MDILTHKINDVIRDNSLHIAVRAAAARGRVILDKYYSRTDESIMYRMAMSMSPIFSLNSCRLPRDSAPSPIQNRLLYGRELGGRMDYSSKGDHY